MKFSTLIGSFLTIAIAVMCQRITNVTPQTLRREIIVHYNIEDVKDGHVFDVALYLSHQYARAFLIVSGDGIGPST